MQPPLQPTICTFSLPLGCHLVRPSAIYTVCPILESVAYHHHRSHYKGIPPNAIFITSDKLIIIIDIKPNLIKIFDIAFLSIYFVIICKNFLIFFFLGVEGRGVQKCPQLSYIINEQSFIYMMKCPIFVNNVVITNMIPSK